MPTLHNRKVLQECGGTQATIWVNLVKQEISIVACLLHLQTWHSFHCMFTSSIKSCNTAQQHWPNAPAHQYTGPDACSCLHEWIIWTIVCHCKQCYGRYNGDHRAAQSMLSKKQCIYFENKPVKVSINIFKQCFQEIDKTDWNNCLAAIKHSCKTLTSVLLAHADNNKRYCVQQKYSCIQETFQILK